MCLKIDLKKIVKGIIAFLFIISALNAQGNNWVKRDSTKRKIIQKLQLQTYEDNLLGYTFDSDDRPFADFTISFRTCIYPFDYVMKMFSEKARQNIHLNLAFTGRFGQYIGTRYSSPVVEKRLNPVLFLEYTPKNKYKNMTLQLGYGHESNGQVIDDSVTFYKTAALSHNDVHQTIDKISRGWDYVGTSIIANYFCVKMPNIVFEGDISLKYYLNYGVFQGKKEEYHPWERNWSGAAQTRNNLNGLSLTFTCYIDSSFINKIKINYETGIANPFYANSIKVLVGFKLGNFPIAFSYRYGYNGDLAQFGKVNQSFGVEYYLSSFNRPDDKRKK